MFLLDLVTEETVQSIEGVDKGNLYSEEHKTN